MDPSFTADKAGLLRAVELLASQDGSAPIDTGIDRCMAHAADLASAIKSDARLQLLAEPETGLVNWRPIDGRTIDDVLARLPAGSASTTVIDNERWLRHVTANPNANPSGILRQLHGADRSSA